MDKRRRKDSRADRRKYSRADRRKYSRADRRKYIYKLELYLMYLIEIDKSGAYIGFQPGGGQV